MNLSFKKIVLVLFLLCSAASLISFSFLADTPLRALILQIEGASWDHSSQKVFLGFVSRYGDWPELMLLGAFGCLMARRIGNTRWQRVFLMAMLTSTLAGAVTNTLRLTTGRTRPRVSPAQEQAWYGPYHEGQWTVGHAEFNSFPSGHTATAFGFAFIILFADSFFGMIALLLAALIASSRLFLGAHHPSDLLVAIVISFCVARFLWYYFTKKFSQCIRQEHS